MGISSARAPFRSGEWGSHVRWRGSVDGRRDHDAGPPDQLRRPRRGRRRAVPRRAGGPVRARRSASRRARRCRRVPRCGGRQARRTEATAPAAGRTGERPAVAPCRRASPAGAAARRRCRAPATAGGPAAPGRAGGPAADGPLTASDRGVTESTIRVGFTIVDLGPARQAGEAINFASPETQQGWWQAAVDEVNNTGGVNGRQIEPVYQSVNVLDSAQAQAACVAPHRGRAGVRRRRRPLLPRRRRVRRHRSRHAAVDDRPERRRHLRLRSARDAHAEDEPGHRPVRRRPQPAGPPRRHATSASSATPAPTPAATPCASSRSSSSSGGPASVRTATLGTDLASAAAQTGLVVNNWRSAGVDTVIFIVNPQLRPGVRAERRPPVLAARVPRLGLRQHGQQRRRHRRHVRGVRRRPGDHDHVGRPRSRRRAQRLHSTSSPATASPSIRRRPASPASSATCSTPSSPAPVARGRT